MNPQTQAGLATADQLLNSSRANYRELSREARSLIDSMTGLPQPRREQWLSRLSRSEKDLDSASSELDQAKELAARNDDELRVEIESRIGQARQKRTQALQAASEILDLARTVSEGGQESRSVHRGGASQRSPTLRLSPCQRSRRSESHDRLAREKSRLESGHPANG